MQRSAPFSQNRLAAFLVVPVSLIFALRTLALEYPLSSQEIRQAYFFGRSSDRGKVAEFLGQYIRVFSPPQEESSFVGRIELRTPYQGVVERSWENWADYSAQRAQTDYAKQAGILVLRLYLYVGAGGPGPADLYLDSKGRVLDRRENFWRDFQFRVAQDHVFQPEKVVARPLYGRRGQGLAGAEVELEFDANDFAPREMRIEIVAPQGRTTTTDFALDQLK
jgi:hypothetical protein